MCHPKGRSAAKDARSALTRRPARSYSAPTIPATVRHARRRSGELPAPLADPPIAPQPTHTRLKESPNSSNPDVNTLLPLAHGTCSTFTPRQRRHDTRHGAYRSHAGIRPHDRCRHWRTGCRSYRGARFPHVPAPGTPPRRLHRHRQRTVGGHFRLLDVGCTTRKLGILPLGYWASPDRPIARVGGLRPCPRRS